jgi:hypothetical protein
MEWKVEVAKKEDSVYMLKVTEQEMVKNKIK